MKNYKKFIIFTIFLSLTLSLVSCSPAREIKLFASESGEIMELLFGFNKSEGESEPNVSSAKGTASAPLIENALHTELIPSPYNPDAHAAMKSIPQSEKITLPSDVILTEAERQMYLGMGYDFIDRIDSAQADVDSIREHFSSSDINYVTVECTGTAPAGDVFAIRYAGFSVSDGYFINPSHEVTLYVSSPKKAELAAENPAQGAKKVYLTFDDGPTGSNTTAILDVLDRYGIKAAFFTTGDSLEKYPDSAKAVVSRGHVLGCHSVTHNYQKIYASVEALEEELVQWEEILEDIGLSKEELGRLTFRFPGGSVGSYFDEYTGDKMKEMLESHGYSIYDWNVVTNDALLSLCPDGQSSYDYIKENFITTYDLCKNEIKSKPDSPIIILMHETVDETVELLPWIIEYLLDDGCVFGSLGDYDGSWTFADR